MATVVIPFQSDDPLRLTACKHVLDYYRYEFPDWPVNVGRSPEPFSRAQAINEGVKRARADIVVVNDGDTLVKPEHLRRAVEYAIGAPGLVYAYTRYRRLTRFATEHLDTYKDAFYSDVGWQMESAPSQSVVVIRRQDFDLIGGMDEQFVDWGYEDMEFAHRAARYAPVRRIPGDLYHIWHGDRREDDSPLTADRQAVARNLTRLHKLVR